MAEDIKRYKGRYTGPQIDDLLGRVPTVEQRVSVLEQGGDDKHLQMAFNNTTSQVFQHNLGKKPSVTVVDSEYNMILADVRHISDNAVQVAFGMSATGFVIFN